MLRDSTTLISQFACSLRINGYVLREIFFCFFFVIEKMGSEADDAEAAAAGAVDSDGSVSWEEFFGK